MTGSSPSREICGGSFKFTMVILGKGGKSSSELFIANISTTPIHFYIMKCYHMLCKIAYDNFSHSYWTLIWLLVKIPSKTVIWMVREAPVGSDMLQKQLHKKFTLWDTYVAQTLTKKRMQWWKRMEPRIRDLPLVICFTIMECWRVVVITPTLPTLEHNQQH